MKTVTSDGLNTDSHEENITFYQRSYEERVALTVQAHNERRTLMERWSVLADAEGSHWSARSSLAAEWLVEEKSITDFGCGMMYLEKYIRPEQQYIPSDVAARDHRTIVCDLNRQSIPKTHTSSATFLGVLEYIYETPNLLAEAAKNFDTLVMTYCVTDAPSAPPDRREHAWVNEYNRAEMEAIIAETGWTIERSQFVDDWQIMWRLKSDIRSSKFRRIKQGMFKILGLE